MLLGLLRRRTEWKAAIAADARRLIESFHEHAYFEACERVGGRCIDGARPARHWTAVKLEIASPAPTCAKHPDLVYLPPSRCEVESVPANSAVAGRRPKFLDGRLAAEAPSQGVQAV